MKNKFYAIFKNESDEFELWSGPCISKQEALSSGEIKVLDTYGSKSRKYMKRVNGLYSINNLEAKYLKVI